MWNVFEDLKKSRQQELKIKSIFHFFSLVYAYFIECKYFSCRPEPIFVQLGPDSITDITVIRAGLDVGTAPLEIRENIAGWAVTKPPCYGDEVDETCEAFQKTLKIVEGTRSNSSTILRHLAEEDVDFIDHSKGGEKKLRDFDDGIVTKTDQETVMNTFASIFEKKVKERNIEHKKDFPSKKTILKDIAKELGTETGSPSFYKEDSETEEG